MPHRHEHKDDVPAIEAVAKLPYILSVLRKAHDAQLAKIEQTATAAVLRIYRALRPEMVAKLKALDEAGQGATYTAQHLALTLTQVTAALTAAVQPMAAALGAATSQAFTFGATSTLAEIQELEHRFIGTEAGEAIALIPPVIPAAQIAQLADAQNLLLQKFADQTVNGTVQDLTQLPGIADKLAESVTLGESIPKAAKRLGQALEAETWKLKRIARTEIINAANVAREQQIEDVATRSPDMGLMKQWSAAECSPRTCPRCLELDGQVIPVSAYFAVNSWRGKAPPQHSNCRCGVFAWSAKWSIKPAKATVEGPPPDDEGEKATPAPRPPRRRSPRKEKRMAIKAGPGREVKNLPLSEFKMLDEEAGTFSGYCAAVGNVDSYGDIIQPGAFKDWLEAAQLAGEPIPILWQHDTEEVLGVCDPADMEEDAKGLRFNKATLVLSVQRATECRDLMKVRAIKSLSIGYTVDEKTTPPKGSPARRILTKLTLWEFSPVTFPANNQARITSVKLEGKAADFNATLDLNEREQDLWERRWALASALGQVMGNLLNDPDVSREDACATVETSLEQFGVASLAWFEDAFDLAAAEREAGRKAGNGPGETKAGKKISAETMKALGKVHDLHQKGTAIFDEARKCLEAVMGVKDDDEADSDTEAMNAPAPVVKAIVPSPLVALKTSNLLDQLRR